MTSSADTLIRSWTIEFSLSPHAGDGLEREAAALVDVDLTPALPYINSELSAARYTPKLPALIWMFEDHQIGILPDRIVIDHIHENEDVNALIKAIVRVINDIWARRDGIQPRETPRSFRQPLEILALLPRSNCSQCGEPTCYSFALKLTAGLSELNRCAPLFDPSHEQAKRVSLENLLREKDPTH